MIPKNIRKRKNSTTGDQLNGSRRKPTSVGHFKYYPKEFVARKCIKGSRHFLREPLAIAIALNDLNRLEGLGATQIRIKDSETNKVYVATLATIKQHGFLVDRGHGLQMAVGLERWNRPDTDAIQAGLFDGEGA